MYSIDSLKYIRDFELFMFEGPEKVEHNFEIDSFSNIVQAKRREPDLYEQIRRDREMLPETKDISIMFDDKKEITIKRMKI